ncbi:MAG: hypothetical protein Q4D06_02145 [Coriobacteriia bacterium]|nr:hypothetical protein [Coriobacteriia bacterium]
MAKMRYTLSSYEPVYAIAPEVKIPESEVQAMAIRWLKLNYCKDGQEPKLNDVWIKNNVKELKSVDELMIFIRYNMYKENREVQELADQNVVCAELAKRLNEELPQDLVEESIYAARLRLDEMLRRNVMTPATFCEQRGITEEQLYADIEAKAIQGLREDSALAAYADYRGYTLEAEDFYAVIPGNTIEEKAYKRRQIEADGRLAGMEEYALKTKALKEIMENAMIKRVDDPSIEYVRYGDVSKDVLNANKQFPDSFVSL